MPACHSHHSAMVRAWECGYAVTNHTHISVAGYALQSAVCETGWQLLTASAACAAQLQMQMQSQHEAQGWPILPTGCEAHWL